MSTYRTTRTNTPVYRKEGGSVQARIGLNVLLNIVQISGNYGRFSSPIVLEDEPQRQWVALIDIEEVISEPAPEPEPEPDPNAPNILYISAGSIVNIEMEDGSFFGTYRVAERGRMVKQ